MPQGALVFLIGYVDDILIFSFSYKNYIEHIRNAMDRLLVNHLYITVKCKVHVITMSFPGYIVGQDGIKMDPAKVVVEKTMWPTPKTVRFAVPPWACQFLQAFHMKFQFYWTRSQSSWKQGSKKLAWNPSADDAFLRLKTAFTMALLLGHPDPTKPFMVEVDASE